MPRAQAGYLKLPAYIRDSWQAIECKLQDKSTYSDIFHIEAIGPLLALTTWPELLTNCLWLHFIDNAAAQATLIRGSSTIYSGDIIAGLTWELIAVRHVYAWFGRVASKSNPVDGLSRGDASGDWDLVDVKIPKKLKGKLVAFCRTLV